MSLLFVEAFGQLLRDPNLEGMVLEDEEDLYSVFRARAELMGWSTSPPGRPPLLWGMNDAKLTVGNDASRIGWVQVGPEVGDSEPARVSSAPARAAPAPVSGSHHYTTLWESRRSDEPAVLLPALIQCLDDALRRFGVVELSGLQVTANSLKPSTESYGDLVGTLNWFNTTLRGRADALIAFDQELLGGHAESELVARLRRMNTGSFEFGPVVAVPERHSIIKAGDEAPLRSISPARSGLGVSVTLPESTASGAAWVLATVIDTARANAPDVSNFAVRVVRI